ncbi:MAG: hypothetical protein E6813_26815, partial [Bradyrhizobium sp.]|nr:hypothetical protein [Bradyrhizobium sp.]
TGAGSEVMSRIAAPMIGGMITAPLLSLFIIPAARAWPKRAKRKVDVYDNWRMPPLSELPPAQLSVLSRVWMIVLRGYLLVAGGLVLVRIFQLATAGA